jgi:hypothetical protein
MATTAVSRQCSKCEKNAGIFNCEGCKEIFCTKHAVVHRQELSSKFEELMTEHNLIVQQVHEKEQQNESSKKDILCRIDQWEKYMIEKVREKAEQVRQRLIHLMSKEDKLAVNNFQDVKDELRNRYETEDFFEHDLERIKQNIDKIKQETDKSIQRSKIKLHVEETFTLIWNDLIYVKQECVKTSFPVTGKKPNHSTDKHNKITIHSSSQRTPAQLNTYAYSSPKRSPAYEIGPHGMVAGRKPDLIIFFLLFRRIPTL